MPGIVASPSPTYPYLEAMPEGRWAVVREGRVVFCPSEAHARAMQDTLLHQQHERLENYDKGSKGLKRLVQWP